MGWLKGLAALQLVFVLLVGYLPSHSTALSVEEASPPEAKSPRSPPPPPITRHPPLAPPPPSPLRYHIAVEGVIYCKSCKLPGYNKFVDASPLPGAVAKLQCNNTEQKLTLEVTTDGNGYFFIQAHDVSSYAAHKCRVYLSYSPLSYCKKPSNLGGGVKGAKLKYERIISNSTNEFALFAAGFLQYAPTTSISCPK